MNLILHRARDWNTQCNIFISPYNKVVKKYNNYKLKTSGLIKNKEDLLKLYVVSHPPVFCLPSPYKTKRLAKNALVVLTENISVPHKIVNGSTGTVVGVPYDKENCVSLCFVKIPNVNVPNIEDGAFPVVRVLDVICMGECRIEVNHFPLQLAYGNTSHKCQGHGFSNALCHVGQEDFVEGVTYSTLSTDSSLKDLYLLERPELNEFISVERFRRNSFLKEFEEDCWEATRLGVYNELYCV